MTAADRLFRVPAAARVRAAARVSTPAAGMLSRCAEGEQNRCCQKCRWSFHGGGRAG
jgi:hypothetical protein